MTVSKLLNGEVQKFGNSHIFEKDKNSVIYKQLTLIKQSRMYFSVQQRVFRERTRTT